MRVSRCEKMIDCTLRRTKEQITHHSSCNSWISVTRLHSGIFRYSEIIPVVRTSVNIRNSTGISLPHCYKNALQNSRFAITNVQQSLLWLPLEILNHCPSVASQWKRICSTPPSKQGREENFSFTFRSSLLHLLVREKRTCFTPPSVYVD